MACPAPSTVFFSSSPKPTTTTFNSRVPSKPFSLTLTIPFFNGLRRKSFQSPRTVPPISSLRRRRTTVVARASAEVPLVGNEPETDFDQEEEEEEFIKESSDGEVPIEDSNAGDFVDSEEKPTSVVAASLQSYKEALVNDDKSKISEVEVFLQSMAQEKISLANEAANLSKELSSVKDRVLRISADFDNYRKRTERDRLSMVTNVQGEVVESLLPVLDNFERAKAQLKLETEGEEKINNSYQSIYKQFVEILQSLGVAPVETVGNPFDPLMHEAIMREDSSEFEEGIIIQEFRKGFKLGDRLLRPSMVKVSAGPGPTNPKKAGPSGSAEASSETIKEGESS